MQAVETATEHGWLGKVPAVQTLRQVWAEHYIENEGVFVWRPVRIGLHPPNGSPYDLDARYSTQRSVEWVGYKVHLTETCDPDTPHLIVNVETTPATTPDDNRIAVVHASLAPRHPLPTMHLADKGYTSAQVLLDSQRDDQVAIVGLVADDPRW